MLIIAFDVAMVVIFMAFLPVFFGTDCVAVSCVACVTNADIDQRFQISEAVCANFAIGVCHSNAMDCGESGCNRLS